jgi:hypothetical protein
MMAKLFGALLATAMLSAQAWSSEAKSLHGGRVTDAGEYHVEMVTKADAVDVYLADHDNKGVSATGHKAVAILVVDGKSQRITLAPAGASRLSGKAAGELPASPKGVVQITLPNGKTVQARFN